MVDCDLKESTTLALNFAKPTLQEGTIIIFDDFNFYKGNRDKGEYCAFQSFKNQNPSFPGFIMQFGSMAFFICEKSCHPSPNASLKNLLRANPIP